MRCIIPMLEARPSEIFKRKQWTPPYIPLTDHVQGGMPTLLKTKLSSRESTYLPEIRTFRQIWKAAARCALFPIAAKHHRSAFPSHHGCLPPSHLSHSTTWDEGCKLKAQKNHQQMVIMVNKILKRASKSERESYGRQKMEEGEDIARTSQAL